MSIKRRTIELLFNVLGPRIFGTLAGTTIIPRRMQGYSGKHTWVVASCHPLWSITWTWALYWTKPIFNWTDFIHWMRNGFGFHWHTQEPVPLKR